MRQDEDIPFLVERARLGSSRAWSRLVDVLSPRAWAALSGISLPREDKEDVHQIVFVRLHQTLERIQDPASLPKWVAVAAIREGLKRKRKLEPQAPEGAAEALPDPDWEPFDQEAVQAEFLVQVHRHIQDISPRCRSLLLALYGEEQLDYKSTSQKLGIPIGSIGPTQARCLEALRRSLREEGLLDVSILTAGGSSRL